MQPPVVLPPEQPVTSAVTTAVTTAVVAVLAPTVASTPSSGRALDAVPVVTQAAAPGGDAAPKRFDSLDLDRMSAGTVAMALAARDAYKNEVFKAAKDELEESILAYRRRKQANLENPDLDTAEFKAIERTTS